MDINQFCADPDDPRQYLHAPINYQGKIIASNGHTIIYKEVDDVEKSELSDSLKDALGKIIPDIDACNNWQPVTDIPEIKPSTCKTCNGEGFTRITDCPECEGAGEVFFENKFNDYEIDCYTCNGKGTIKAGQPKLCEECKGGDVYYRGIDIAGSHINPKYWLMIADQPGLLVSRIPDRHLFVFQFGDYRGGIMEMIP